VTVDITDGAPPAAPSDLVATAVSSTEINLSYAESDTSQTGFTIERATDPSFINFTRVFTINRSTALTYSDTGLSPSTTYYYRVQAFNSAGNSGFSNVASATTTATANPSNPAAPAGLAQQYVAQLYEDLLGRAADSNGLATFSTELDQGQTAAQVVGALLGSTEYRQNLVQQLYSSIFGRAADATGLSVFVADLADGATQQQVAATIYASPEFFALHGSTNQGFIVAVYQDALGRPVDQTGLSAFMAMLNGGATRQQVAGSILASQEYRQDKVNALFEAYLKRPPGTAEVANYAAKLAAGTVESVITQLVTSHEYFVTRLGAIGTLNEAFVNLVFQDLLGRPADSVALQTFGPMLDAQPGVAGRQAVVLAIEASAEYRADLVESYYQRYLGRSAAAQEISDWTTLIAAGSTDENVIAGIVGSNEYYADHGSTAAGFLSAAIADLTQQPADPTSATFLLYQQELQAGTSTRSQVAQSIAAGSAYQNAVVNLLFQTLLLRDADATGLAAFTSQLAAGSSDEQITAEIAASAEYFGRV
jgi:hypothetical protein